MTLKTATNIAIAGTILWISSHVISYTVGFTPELASKVYSTKIGPIILGAITVPLPITYLIFFITFRRKQSQEAYKDNKNNLSNQNIDPTRKTPVESGND